MLEFLIQFLVLSLCYEISFVILTFYDLPFVLFYKVEGDVLYPINNVARLYLLDYYQEQYVIQRAVIELLKDYNPFSTRTGLTKKQVTKYLKILLEETPDLAEYIIACLPDAEDLLPPDILERVPKDHRPSSEAEQNGKRKSNTPIKQCTPPAKRQRPSRPKAPPRPPELCNMQPALIEQFKVREQPNESTCEETQPTPNILRPANILPRPPDLCSMPAFTEACKNNSESSESSCEWSHANASANILRPPKLLARPRIEGRTTQQSDGVTTRNNGIITRALLPKLTKSPQNVFWLGSPNQEERQKTLQATLHRDADHVHPYPDMTGTGTMRPGTGTIGQDMMTVSELNSQLVSVWGDSASAANQHMSVNLMEKKQCEDTEVVKAITSSSASRLSHGGDGAGTQNFTRPIFTEPITELNFHQALPALSSAFHPAPVEDLRENQHDPLLGATSSKAPSGNPPLIPLDLRSCTPRLSSLDRTLSVDTDFLTDNLSVSYLSNSLADLSDTFSELPSTQQHYNTSLAAPPLTQHTTSAAPPLTQHTSAASCRTSQSGNRPVLHIPNFPSTMSSSVTAKTQELCAPPLSPALYMPTEEPPTFHNTARALEHLWGLNPPLISNHESMSSIPATAIPRGLHPSVPRFIYTTSEYTPASPSLSFTGMAANPLMHAPGITSGIPVYTKSLSGQQKPGRISRASSVTQLHTIPTIYNQPQTGGVMGHVITELQPRLYRIPPAIDLTLARAIDSTTRIDDERLFLSR